MIPSMQYDPKYLESILSGCFCSDVGESYEAALDEIERICPTPEHRKTFATAVREMLLDPSMTFVGKCEQYVGETFATESDAVDFLTFIWESVTDEPWPSEIPKGNGKRFLPPPGHARGY